MSDPIMDDLTITADARLLDTVPMSDSDRPDRQFLPEKISVKYWTTPEGWRVWCVWIEGHAILKSGEIGKSTRGAFYGLRGDFSAAPAWVQEFAAAHVPGGGTR